MSQARGAGEAEKRGVSRKPRADAERGGSNGSNDIGIGNDATIDTGNGEAMTEDRMSKIYREMLEDLESLNQKWFKDFQEEMSSWTQDLLKDAFDPARMMQFLGGMGIDMSRFSQMFGRMAQAGTMPQGFDPYQVLGLDKSASDEEVKKRYRELVNILHQDKSKTSGTNFLFQIVVAAYELIKRERGWQ